MKCFPAVSPKSEPKFQPNIRSILVNLAAVLMLVAFCSHSYFTKTSSAASNNVKLSGTLSPGVFDGSLNDPLFATGPGFDDAVLNMAQQPDGKLIIVGKFNYAVGVASQKIIRLDTNGNVDATFQTGTGANGNIQSVAIQFDGKVLVAGDFTSINGNPSNRVARLNQNGTLDPSFDVGSGPNAIANAVAVQLDGKVVVGGMFTSFSGVSSNAVVRLELNGSVDSTFSASASVGPGGPVNCIAVQTDNKVLIGGSFSVSGGRNGITRLQSNGALDSTFLPSVNSGSSVRSVVIDGGSILLGGTFNSVNGVPRAGIGRITSSGAVDTSFLGSGVATVSGIAVQSDGKVIVGGSTNNSNVSRLNINGSLDSGFASIEFSTVNSVLVGINGEIFVGGRLGTPTVGVGGASPAGVRKLNSDGSRDNSFLTRTGATDTGIFNVAFQTDRKILITGDFFNAGGLARAGFARLEPDGALDEAYQPAVTGFSAFALQPDGKVIVGGNRFTTAGTHSFYRLNTDGSIDQTFTADSTTPNGATSNISSIAVQSDGKIIAVGGFESINGQSKRSLVRLESNGNIDSTFNPNLNFSSADVKRLVIRPNGKIIASGHFQSVGTTRSVFQMGPNGIVEWFSQTGGTSDVSSLSIQDDGKVLITGGFTQVSGVPLTGVARLNVDGTVDADFHPPLFTGNPVDISAVLPLRGGKILIGGTFATVSGVPVVGGFARLNSNGSYDASFVVSMDSQSSVSVISQQPDGRVVFGGRFSGVNGVARGNISRLRAMYRSSMFDFDGDGKTDISIFRPNGATGSEWWYLKSSNGGNFATQFGSPTDKLVAADYTGDGKADIAFWRPSTGEWFVLRSEDSTFFAFPFGASGDVPAPADYDGDGKADAAVFRLSSSTWFIQNSGGGTTIQTFGSTGDVPVAGDYDGDGKADIAIFRPSGTTGSEWWILRSTAGLIAMQFGAPTDKTVVGDYTGDGKTDVAFWRPSTGEWYILRSEDSSFYAFPFGANGDIPVPGEYDGDGKTDAAIFRPSNSTWYVLGSTSGTVIQQFGTTGDQPVPNEFVR